MKTFLIVSDRRIDNHAGEEWDDYLEVADQPTSADIQEWANRIRGRIRRLHVEDVKEIGEGQPGEPGVEAQVDAASPFAAVLLNLQILMRNEEGISLILPQFDGVENTTTDEEALELIGKLDSR